MSKYYNFLELVGKLLPFDPKTYPLDKLFLREVQSFFNKQGKSLTDLKQLHHVIEGNDTAKLYAHLYDFVQSEEFVTIYDDLQEKVIQPLFKKAILYQRVPSIRIQMPGGKSVQFHTDEWYGHGENVVNLWLPITPVANSNTLQYVDRKRSIELIEQFERDKATIETINETLEEYSEPVNTDFGAIMLFSSKCAHGTFVNETQNTRLSIDFRLVFEGEDSGTKAVGDFYVKTRQKEQIKKEAPREVCAYIYAGHGFTRYITHPQQRIAVNAFNTINNLKVIAEETEVKTMAHHPQLLYFVTGKKNFKYDCIVIYSTLCLPESFEDRQRIYATAIENKTDLYFALEDLKFPKENSIEDIENALAKLQFASA
jgi:sporadic carbohydrate cluster 2OG-Fe(II) oxygenase/sporadic carbohydrate cluster protein (TIGR04323 family)